MRAKTLSRILLSFFVPTLISTLIVFAKPADAAPVSNAALKWSTQQAAGNGTWSSIAWSPELGKFVAVARSSAFPIGTVQRIMSSTDAKNWTLVSGTNVPATPGVFTSIAWSPAAGLFVAVTCGRTSLSTCTGTTNLRVMTSPDGDVWTERVTPDTDSTWQSIVWSPELNLFVAVSDGGTNSVMTSPDGVNWTARTVPEDNAWKSVTWSPELNIFVAIASSGANRVMTSPDGVNWTSRSASEANTWTSVTWSPDLDTFVAVSSDGTNRVMTSMNGTTWIARAAATANTWTSVTWSPALGKFAAVASSGTNRVMTSSDGTTWTAQSASVDNSWNAITWSPALGTFVAVGSTGATNAGPPFTSARVMTGSMITAGTDVATNVAARGATLHGDYADSFPSTNIFFTGTNTLFRYRIAGSSDPFTDTTPQAQATAGTFTANITSLEPNTAYEFKAVVQWPGAAGTQTLEGGLQTFTTLLADDDNDGIYNVIEDAAPNSGDANNDGTLDSTQSFVASFVNSVTGKYAALELNNVCQVNAVEVKPEADNTVGDLLYEYPVGLMHFTADCGTPGYTTNVSQYYFGAAANSLLRKYDANSHTYFTLTDTTQQSATIGGQTAIKAAFTITDGSNRDMNGATDGIIVDPAGLAVVLPSSGAGTPTTSGGLADTGQNVAILGSVAVLLLASGLLTYRYKQALFPVKK